MRKKKKNDKIEQTEEIKETALEEIETELEETEEYQKASFMEKMSLKFRKRLITNRLHTLVLIIFLIVIVWGLNIWADSKNLAQIDVTKNQLYSVTDVSKDQLKNLEKEVIIYVYGYTKTDEVVQFLAQYNAFNQNIKYEIISESTNYELVTKYSLGSTSALVVTCGDKDRTIYPDYEFSTSDYTSGDTINLAEEVITNAILKVSTDDPIKVYYATGNGEYDKEDLNTLSTYLEEEVYEVEDLNLMTITEIPNDCDILALFAPQDDITESQAELIKNYINNGGSLIICALTPTDSEFSNLQSVLDLYGATINKGLLYEGDSRHYLAYQNSLPLPYVLVPDCSSSNEITSKLSNSNQMIIMPWSQSITTNDVEEENVTVTNSSLLTTSSNCYNIIDFTNGLTKDTLNNSETNSYVIGSEFTRKISNEEEEIESKLILYANTEFFLDSYRDANIQLSTMSNPGNINLVMNSFAELAEEEDLITVRKAANVTEFQSTESQSRTVKLIIFGIPVLIIIIGIFIWNHRRKQR